MSRYIVLVLALLAAAGGSTPALAQLQPKIDIGVGVAGGKGTGAGLVGQVAFEFLPASKSPLGIRIDVSHHRWDSNLLNGMGTYHASAATMGLAYRLPTERVRPYVLAGVGGYSLRGEGLKGGWNIGEGLEVPAGRYNIFGEIRAHFVASQYNETLVPFVFGVRF